MLFRLIPLLAVLLTVASASSAFAQPGENREAGQVRYFSRQWTFEDVDIGKLIARLERVGIDVPLAVDGQITATLSVGVPWNALRDARAWRASGRLTSPRLTVEAITVEAAALGLSYRDGVLSLSELEVRLPSDDEGPPGRVAGAADMALVPRGDLEAELVVDRLPLAPIASLVEGLPPIAGRLTGKLSARAAVDQLRDVGAWTASGPIEVSGFTLREAASVDATAVVELTSGVVTARELQLQSGNLSVEGEGELSLAEKLAWSLDLEAIAPEVQELFTLLESYLDADDLARARELVVQGGLRGSAELSGVVGQERFNVAGQVQLTEVRLNIPEALVELGMLPELTFPELAFRYLRTDNQWEFSEIVGRLAGGQIAGATSIPVDAGTFTASLDWARVNLAELLEPAAFRDSVASGEAAVEAPWAEIGDASKYKLQATVNLQDIQYRGATLSLDTGPITFGDGRLSASSLTAEIDGQEVTAAVAATLVSPAEDVGDAARWRLSVDIKWEAIDLGRIARLVSDFPIDLSGTSSGNATLEIPEETFSQPSAWSGRGVVQVDAVDVYDWQLRDVTPISLQLADGVLQIEPVTAQLDGEPLSFEATLGLASPWPITMDLAVEKMRLDRLQSIPPLAEQLPTLSGRVDLSGKLQGTISPLKLTGSGELAATDLVVKNVSIENASLQYQLSEDGLSFHAIRAQLYDGEISGETFIPLTAGDDFSVTLQWQQLDLAPLLADLEIGPRDFGATSSGSLELVVPDDAWQAPARWTADVQARFPEIHLGAAMGQEIVFEAAANGGQLVYSATGVLFSGQLDVSGEGDFAAIVEGTHWGEANWKLHGADLRQAASIFQKKSTSDSQVAGSPVAGNIDAEWTSQVEEGIWQWNGEATVNDFSIGGSEIVSSLEATATGNQQNARLQLTGRMAGGQLRGQGSWDFARSSSPKLRIGLRGASLGSLAQLVPGLDATQVAGQTELELRLRPGDVWRAVGTVAVRNGEYNGLEFRTLRFPLLVDWAPTTGRIDLRLSSIQGALSRGRATGRLVARRSTAWRLDGEFRFYRVDVGTLLEGLGSGADYAQGRLTGRLRLGGRAVRSLADLEASLAADLDDTQASNVPLLSRLVLYVPGAAVGSSRFSEGRIEAKLRNGVIRLAPLTLASSRLQIYLTGQMTLAGRLGLEAVVSTGDPIDPGLADALLSRLVVAAVPPAAVVLAANDLLANRVIHLKIHGTLSRPVIHVRPLKTLSREAIRYFLRQASGGLAGGVGAGVEAGGR